MLSDSEKVRAIGALKFIIPILEKYQFQWVVTGGFATLAYGVDRPLTDIDIDIDTSRNSQEFQSFLHDVESYITQPLEHFVNDSSYDNFNVELTYNGQVLDICPMSDLKIFNKKFGAYQSFYTGFPEIEMIDFDGITLPLLAKELVIKNKEDILRDEWDSRDIAGLKALQ